MCAWLFYQAHDRFWLKDVSLRDIFAFASHHPAYRPPATVHRKVAFDKEGLRCGGLRRIFIKCGRAATSKASF